MPAADLVFSNLHYETDLVTMHMGLFIVIEGLMFMLHVVLIERHCCRDYKYIELA